MSVRIDGETVSVAVAHGNYVGRGGGERVAEAIARAFDAPLFYGFGDEKYTPDDIDTHSLFNDIRGAEAVQRVYQLRDLYYMYGWRSVPELHDFDVVIQSGNEPSWYKPPDDQVILKYTHSTPRNAYDRYPDRSRDSGLIYDAYCFATEQLYQPTVAYPDLFIANSDVIQRRLSKYWGVSKHESRVICPPVQTDALGAEYAGDSPIDGDYYVVLDRLEPTKHVDGIIQAFRKHPDKHLVIAGTGSEEQELKAQARDMRNVTFLGYVDEGQKASLLAGAKAHIYGAENEDFGIVPIEALASGTPVIGPREGFTQYQLADGATGILYERGPGAIAQAISRFDSEGVKATAKEMETVADQYRPERFEMEMRRAVADAIDDVRINNASVQAGVPVEENSVQRLADGGEVSDGD